MKAEDLIQKSLSGNISEQELELLKQALASQPELSEVLTIEHAMYLHRNQKLKAELRNSIPSTASLAPSAKSRLGKALLIVLIILGLGYIGYSGYKDSTEKPSLNNFADIHLNDKSVSPVRLMGDTEIDKNLWSKAIDSYGNGDYDEALVLIKNIESKTSEQKLYEALCHAYKSNPDYSSASTIMKKLQKSSEILVYDQALWYGALIDVKLGRVDDAKSQLTKIIDANLWKAQEAKELKALLK